MAIYRGNNLVNAIYKGSTPIQKVYRGDSLVFGSGGEPDQPSDWIVGTTVSPNQGVNFKLFGINRTEASDADGKLAYSPTSPSTLTSLVNFMDFSNNQTRVKTLDLRGMGDEVSEVTTMAYAFRNLKVLESLDVSNWKTDAVTTLTSIFHNCQLLTELDINDWDTSNVTTLSSTFNNCQGLVELDLSKWNTSNVTYMGSTFNGCISLERLILGEGWDISNVDASDAFGIFYGCTALNYIKCTQSFKDFIQSNASSINLPENLQEGGSCEWDIIDKPVPWFKGTTVEPNQAVSFRLGSIQSVTSDDHGDFEYLPETEPSFTILTNFFNHADSHANLKTIDLRGMGDKVDAVTNMNTMFFNCAALEKVDMSNWVNSKNTYLKTMFNGCTALTEVKFSPDMDTSLVKSFYQMFQGCSSLTDIDISTFSNPKALVSGSGTNLGMGSMFSGCTALESITFGPEWLGADSVNSQYLSQMFSGCDALNYIKCTQSFKDLLQNHAGETNLPESMQEDGDGTWEIIP